MSAPTAIGCVPTRRAPLAGAWDWIVSAVDPAAAAAEQAKRAGCPDSAANARAPIDNNRKQVDAWVSTGYYTPDELDAIVGHQLDVMHAARTAVSQAYADSNVTAYADAHAQLDTITANLNTVEQQAMDYIHAVAAARDNGDDAIAAPLLHDWCVETLRRVGDAVETSYLVECNVPSWFSLLSGVTSACEAFAAAVIAVVGVVINVATKVGQAAERTFGALAWIAANAPTIVLIGMVLAGGAFAYRKRDKIRTLFKRKPTTAR